MLLAVLGSVFRASNSLAGAVTSTASGGNWGTSSTWVGNKVPGTGDDVTIVAGASVTVTASDTVHSITFANNNASTSTLTVNSGATLGIGTSITAQNSATTNTAALIQGAGGITCGTLTVGGTTTPTPPGSDFTATLTSTISNLNVFGALTVKALYNPGPAAANQGTFALGSGTVVAANVSFVTVPFFGPILTLATGSQNGTLVLSNAAPFTSSGGGSSTFTPNGANATVVYGGATQAVNAAVYQNLTFAGSGVKTNTGVTVNGVLSMQGTATASAAPVYGSQAVLEYNGTIAQTNSAELISVLRNLTINNANGVTFTNGTLVSNVLTLASGVIAIGANSFTIGTNGSTSGGTTSSYVNGKVQKNFNPGTQSFVFPVGDTEFAPVNVSNLSVAAAGGVIVSTVAGAPAQIGSSGINTSLNVNRYWILTSSGGTFGSYGATFNYPSADVDPAALAPQFVVPVLSGTTWSMATVSGTPTTNSTSISGQSGFGTFVIGDPTNTALKLSITSINGGASPLVGSPFNVTVQSQDGGGTARNVTQNTSLALNLQAGTGVLGGTLTGTISAGSSSVTIAGATYSVAQSGVKLGAAVTSGQALSNAVSSAFTVNPGNQTITFPSPGNQTYGVAPITLSATSSSGLAVSYSVTSGPATVSGSVLTITGAGSVKIQASQSGNANWNAATPVSQTISVATKSVTGTFTAKNKTYDGTTNASIASSGLTGVINSDVVNLTVGSMDFTNKNVGNGKTVIASGLGLSGANAGNYTLASTFATNTANITAATLTVTANNTNRLYGAANPAFTASYSGFVNGETNSVLSGSPSLATTATPSSSVGGSPYSITVTQGTLSAANYTFTFVNGNLTVTRATLTVTANNTNRLYGAANPAFTASYSGFVNGENTSVLSGTPSVTTSATASSNVAGSPYAITVTQGTLSAANYTIDFVNGSLSITPATLTVTANNTNRVYGAANPAFTVAYSGFVNGENTSVLSGAPSVTTSATASSNVAGNPYAITVTQGTLSAANYTFDFVSGSLSITPATLTVTANNTNRVYGAANPAFTVAYSGFVNGDGVGVLSGTPSVASTATPSSSVSGGPYPITATQGTLSAANYSFTFVDGGLTVTPATLTVTANNTNRLYGAADPVFMVSYSGFVNGENTSVLSGAPSVTTSTTSGSSVAGSPYAITVTQGTLSAANYTFNFVNGGLSITAAVLTVTANNTNRVYGAANPGFTVNYTGFVNGENSGVLSGAPSVATTATPSSSVAGGPYPITATQGTLSAANYSFTFVDGGLTVTPATLTVTGNNTNIIYGVANPAFTVSYSGFVNGENTSVLSGAPSVTTSATTGSSVAGSPYAITVTQGTLSAANYTFIFINGSLSITAAALMVTANDTNRIYGAANPVFTVSYSGFVNGEDAGILSGAPSVTTTATPSSPVPGGPYPITVTQGTLNADNYSFTFANGNLTIIPATLTVTVGNTNRTYGAADPSFTLSYSGFVNGEDTNVLSGVASITTTADTNSSVPGSPYAIAVAQGSLSATNYTFAFVNGNLAITPATLTVSADNQWRPFGATNPVLTATCSGFVNAETTNVLSGTPALSTAADSNSAPGTYPIQIAAGTLSATNYIFSFNNGTLTVNSLPPILTIQLVTDPTNAVVISTVGLAPSSTYQIIGSTDMVNWAEIGTAQSAVDGSLIFTNVISAPAQFYRTSGL